MRILFIVPYVPNLIRVRPYNIIRSLAARGHKIDLFTLWSTEEEYKDSEKLKKYCDHVEAVHLSLQRSLINCAIALPSKTPLQYAFCWQPQLAKRITARVGKCNEYEDYDVIHVEHLRGARFGIHLIEELSGNNLDIPVVWDSVDSISHLFKQSSSRNQQIFNRLLTGFELSRTEDCEGWLVDQFDRTLVTSSIDREVLSSLSGDSGSSRISILPNGVDLDYFKPLSKIHRKRETLVLSGKMSYHANISMALYLVNEIMPQVWSKKPEVELWIVGKDPSREIRSLDKNPRIHVTGTVEDIRPYLQTATLAIAPVIYGAGIQNKVLEAMACATPVISSPQAVSPLNINRDEDVVVAETTNEYANSIIQFLDNEEMRDRIGENGRIYVEHFHKWSNIIKQLEQIYQGTFTAN